jgi:hypothetical protein
MDIPFKHLGYQGHVSVFTAATQDPTAVGAWEGARGLAQCTAVIQFGGQGYRSLMGWIQLVRSTDNRSQGRQFEMDPFDPFDLYTQAPSPYAWYGITPTLFDAPSRDERVYLDWVAHSFLAVSPQRVNRRSVTPLLGFSWGFHVTASGDISLDPLAVLTPADWSSHLPTLRETYPGWQFAEMPVTL